MASNSKTDDTNEENTKVKQDVDVELDDLLDDALADFEKVSLQTKKTESESKDKSHKQSIDSTEFSLDEPLNDDLFNQIYEKVMAAESDQGNFLQNDVDTSGDLADTIQKALNSLNKDLGNFEDDSDMSKEMMDMLSRMGSDENDATIMPLIHDMMSNLLSKDVLYPSLKDISLKYPQWLSENEGNLDVKELKRYKEQQQLMEQIVREYEDGSPGDDEKTKKDRFERILDNMQKLQQLGHPPKEIVGDMAKDFQFDEEQGLPGMTDANFNPNQCSAS